MALFSAALSLGGNDILRFELPESVNLGTTQKLYNHDQVGGLRRVDAMGSFDPDITWSGYFSSFEGELRARFFEGLARQGKPLLLKTSSYTKNVVIASFTYQFKKIQPFPYSMTVRVIQDLTQPVTFLIPGDYTDEIIAALIAAIDLKNDITDGGVQGALAALASVINGIGNFNTATAEQIASAVSAVVNAQSAIGTAIGSIEGGGLFG